MDSLRQRDIKLILGGNSRVDWRSVPTYIDRTPLTHIDLARSYPATSCLCDLVERTSLRFFLKVPCSGEQSLRASCDWWLHRIPRERIAGMLLHNPERVIHSGSPELVVRRQLERLSRATEDAALPLGVATWRVATAGALSPSWLRAACDDALGQGHRVRYYQHPTSLVRIEHVVPAVFEGVGPLQDRLFDWIASSPLHGGVVTKALPVPLASLGGLDGITVTRRMLLSLPSVVGVVIGFSRFEQMDDWARPCPPLSTNSLREILAQFV